MDSSDDLTQGLPDLMSSFNMHSSNPNRFSASQLQWPSSPSTNPVSHSHSQSQPQNPSPSASSFAGRPTTFLSRRTSFTARQEARYSNSTSNNSNAEQEETTPTQSRSPLHTPSIFTASSRNLFSSGLPTASVSASTAQASMSSPQPSNLASNPLSALSSPNLNNLSSGGGSRRREQNQQGQRQQGSQNSYLDGLDDAGAGTVRRLQQLNNFYDEVAETSGAPSRQRRRGSERDEANSAARRLQDSLLEGSGGGSSNSRARNSIIEGSSSGDSRTRTREDEFYGEEGSSSARRQQQQHTRDNQGSPSSSPSLRRPRFVNAEKDADDPSGAIDTSLTNWRRELNSTALSRLFTAQSPGSSPTMSRHHSYARTSERTQRPAAGGPANAITGGGGQVHANSSATHSDGGSPPPSLPNHLYTRGLLSGRHSDVTVHAFGASYQLHRLLLDRSPFFSSLLSTNWSEGSQREIELHPEDIDANITKSAFELALKRIYGCGRADEEADEAAGLFATGCWLDMEDLIEASIGAILRQLAPANLAAYVRLVTRSYYGRYGERILAAAKAMLCREGHDMPLIYFDGISADVLRDVVACDGFFVPGEWERFVFIKRLLDRRLKNAAFVAGLLDSSSSLTAPRPEPARFAQIRAEAVAAAKAQAGVASGGGGGGSLGTGTMTSATSIASPGVLASPEGASEAGEGGDAATGACLGEDRWARVYGAADVAPILALADEGVYYVHFTFEQLQRVRELKDILGMPLLPEKVLSDALWMSIELRQKIVNTPENNLDVGLQHQVDETDALLGGSLKMSEKAAGKAVAGSQGYFTPQGADDADSKPRFWVPTVDAAFVLNGDGEAGTPTSESHPHHPHHASGHPASAMKNRNSRVSTSIDPTDAQWASELTSTFIDRPDTPLDVADYPNPKVSYSHYPPFRFAVEFAPARSLKEGKRVYSSTVWYAGSWWNVYVQRKETLKHTQLGVYLHRERQGSDVVLANLLHKTVDERIGCLEREIMGVRPLRGGRDGSGAAGNGDITLGERSTLIGGGGGGTVGSDLGDMSRRHQGATNPYLQRQASSSSGGGYLNLTKSSSDGERSDGRGKDDEDGDKKHRAANSSQNSAAQAPALPPYSDNRQAIRTYFTLHVPSQAGRAMSVYESKPDEFNFSQSWGWKSPSLVLDDGLPLGGGAAGVGGVGGGAGGGGYAGLGGVGGAERLGLEDLAALGGAGMGAGRLGARPKMRFMVAIGNV